MYSITCDNIIGLWNKNKYNIVRLLGRGGIGEVYLAVQDGRGPVALKASRSMLSVTKEYDNMKRLKDKQYIPAVYELDDCMIEGEIHHFFTMEYIEGYDLTRTMKNKMPLKLKVAVFMIVLKIIADINEEGYIYTDLKHENIMIDERNLSVRLVDCGSLTQIGRVVNEYTSLYDRFSWGLGDRTADTAYQVCGAAILLITLLIGRRPKPGKDRIPAIMDFLAHNDVPKPLIELLDNALNGRIDNCRLFCEKLEGIDLYDKNRRWVLNAFLDIVIVMLILLLGVVLANLKALAPIYMF